MRSFPVGARIARASSAKAPKAEAASANAVITMATKNFIGISPKLISKLDDDLAEMLVGVHALERLADVVKGKHLVDRELQLARFHRAPEVAAGELENLADFLDRAGAEGDTDIVDAARGVQVEVEIGVRAAEPADIDDAAFDFGRFQVLARDLAGDLIDDQIDAFA